jgi:hypothetical protein
MRRINLYFLCLIGFFLIGRFDEETSLNVQLKKELIGRTFQTKVPLGISYNCKDAEGYSAKLSVVNEIHGEEIRYFAEGGLKIASRESFGQRTITPKKYSGRYVSLSEIEFLPEGTIVEVEKIDIKKNQFDISLIKPGGEKVKLRLMTTESLDFETIMVQIAQVLKMDSIELLKNLSFEKSEAEKKLKDATSPEDKFESLFKIKWCIEEILKIDGLSSVIYSKYSNENTQIDSKIEELYGSLKEPLIIIESIILEPQVVKKGDVLNLEVKYRLVTPKDEKEIKVIENINLSGKNLVLPLKKRESQRTEGSHLFSTQFILPMDLEAGEYTLITTIEAGNKRKIMSKSFTLKEKDWLSN